MVIRGELQAAAGRFAALDPLGGTFQTVAHGVADEMGKRLGNYVQQALVEISVGAVDHKFNLFAALACNVTHDARKAPQQLFHRNHANFHYRALQVT